MRALRRGWLAGLLLSLFALPIADAPAQHARAVLARSAVALALAEPGALHAHTGPEAPADGHREHQAAAACFACILMAAPGLLAPPSAQAARSVAAVPLRLERHDSNPTHGSAWAPNRARAPPSGFPA